MTTPTPISVQPVRLSNGRLARQASYSPALVERVDRLMREAGYPRTGPYAVGAGLIHGLMLVLLSVESIDGIPQEWPEPTADGVQQVNDRFVPADVELLRARFAATVPPGAPITLPVADDEEDAS